MSSSRPSLTNSTWSEWFSLSRPPHSFLPGLPTLSTCLRSNTCVHTFFSVCVPDVERSRAEGLSAHISFSAPFLECGFTSPTDQCNWPPSHASTRWFTFGRWQRFHHLSDTASLMPIRGKMPSLSFSSLAENHMEWVSLCHKSFQRKIPQLVCIPMFLLIQLYPGNPS